MSKDHLDIGNITAIRGATTSSGNTFEEIENSVIELIDELILRNNLDPKKILSITFTITKDLDACFPASIARKSFGLDSVAFLDCQQMHVPNDIDFCIRLMALVILPNGSLINHNWNNKRDYIRSRMDLYDTDNEKFFKCLCYTKKGTKCKCNTNGELNYIQNNLNEIVMSGYKKFNKGFMEHNELYTIKYLVGELSYYKADRHRNVLYGLPRDKDYRQQAYISRLCKRHESENLIEYARKNGYAIRNGYVIRTKPKGEY